MNEYMNDIKDIDPKKHNKKRFLFFVSKIGIFFVLAIPSMIYTAYRIIHYLICLICQ